MAKVIVERPRRGSSMPSKKKGYRRAFQRMAVDELPLQESMLGRWHGMQRSLNETLNPMHRFLRSNIGRPWNKVHQELCEYVSFDNAVQKHVLAHVFQFVKKNVQLQNGLVFHKREWGGRFHPLDVNEMYICPTTGLLRAVRPSKRRQPMRRIQVGPLTQYHLRDNSWWEVGLRKLPQDTDDLWDLWLDRKVGSLSPQDRQRAYGGEMYAVSQRPLRPAEVKELHRRYSRDSKR